MQNMETPKTHRRKIDRPQMPEKEKRRHKMTIALNDAERAELDQQRGKVPAAVYLRQSWRRRGGAAVAIVPAINREQWAQLSTLQANINQIARNLNAGEPLKDELDNILAAVKDLRRALIAIKRERHNRANSGGENNEK